MKLILFLIYVTSILSLSLFGSDIEHESKFKFQNKVIETITIKENRIKLEFKILCLNGYKYLYIFGSGENPVQMFSKDKKSRQSVPISCNGFEDSDENK